MSFFEDGHAVLSTDSLKTRSFFQLRKFERSHSFKLSLWAVQSVHLHPLSVSSKRTTADSMFWHFKPKEEPWVPPQVPKIVHRYKTILGHYVNYFWGYDVTKIPTLKKEGIIEIRHVRPEIEHR